MRTSKILAILVGGIIALLMAALLAVKLWVNPNDYKAKIAAEVKNATGRELILTGDIKLSVFPWVALELGPASLGNPPGFGAGPFLVFDHAKVRVRLFPLFAKRLEMDRIEIEGLDLSLRKNAQGHGNWESSNPTEPAPAAKTDAKAGAGTPGSLPELAGISVKRAKVSYPGLVIENLNLETGAFGGHGVTPISISFDANRALPNESVTLNAKFGLSADVPGKGVQFAAVNITGEVSLPGDERPAHWEMSAPAIDVNLDSQTVAVPAFTLGYSNARLTGKLAATKILDDLSATGTLTLAPLDLREFAPRRMALPKTHDPKVFAQFSAGSEFSYGASGLHLELMKLELDDTHLAGSAALTGEPKALKFELTVDHIDLDRYRSDAPDVAAKPQPKPAAAAGGAAMDADGTLSIGSVHFSVLDLTNVRVTLASKDHVVHVFPLQAQIDGGRYSGDITLDQRAAIPALSLDEHLSGIDMSRLLASTAYKGRLSGHGNVDLKATAHGAALEPVLQSLNGHFDANLTEGAIEGVDVSYELGQAQALLNRQSATARENTHHTPFDAFKMSAEIVNGLATTKDLAISSQVVRVTGQGSANLPSKALNLQLLASVLKSPTATVADIPLKITGTYDDPTVRPDLDALAKGQVKQKLQDVLKKNGLEKLFGK